jgi:hypothetical protein
LDRVWTLGDWEGAARDIGLDENDMTDRPLTDRQLATMLAALRWWQNRDGSERFTHIATDGRRFDPLDDNEIDVLCEALNTGRAFDEIAPGRPVRDDSHLVEMLVRQKDPSDKQRSPQSETAWRQVLRVMDTLNSYDPDTSSNDEAHDTIALAKDALRMAINLEGHAKRKEQYREAVRREWQPAFPDGDLVIDPEADVKPQRGGALVQVWMFVSDEDAGNAGQDDPT